MATYNSFNELPIWQKSHSISLMIYKISNDSELKIDFSLKDQIRRSAVSISSNIAEGHDRSSKKEYCYFLNVAKGSSAELRSQLFLVKDLGYIDENQFNLLDKEIQSLNKMIGGFIKYLKQYTPNN